MLTPLLTHTYADAVRLMRPVSYWRLNESGGTRAIDQMGVNHASYSGSPGLGVSGAVPDGSAVKLTTGGGTVINCGTPTLPTTAYSFAVWAYITAQPNPDAGLIGRWQVSVGAMIYKPNATSVVLLNRGTSCTSGAVSMNRWHFFVGTWDGANLRLYVDGLLAAGPTATATAPGSQGLFGIGSYDVTNSLVSRIISGSLAEGAYWSRALSAGEIAHLNAIGWGR